MSAREFEVLGEEEEFLAVDKPAGMLAHPTKPGGPRTLLDGLRELLSFEAATGGTISIINRLDRETSGVVLVAKTANAARELARGMARREIAKEYLALCFGWPERDEFEVEAPIRRLGEVGPARVWLKRGVHEGGQAARTLFRVEGKFSRADGQRFSLLRALPLTGRTHQIRVHLAHAGHPVIGDKLYARGEDWYLHFIEKGWTEEMRRALWLPRHALHSARIAGTFLGKPFRFESPLPPDLRNPANA